MGIKKDTVYIKFDKNTLVKVPAVTLNDAAKLTSSNEAALRQIKQIKLHTFHEPPGTKKNKPQQQVFSVLKVIQLIQNSYPDIEVENIGESDFILIYNPNEDNKVLMYLKSAILCIIFFFGSGFSIMTFNKDAAVSEIFTAFYEQIMGKQSSGFTEIEISYSIGLGLGILVFFNHIGKRKITHDPIPMQVQMRLYEEDVDKTFIENSSRKGSNIDVD